MILLSLAEKMSTRKALSYVGASKNMLFYSTASGKKRAPLDGRVAGAVKKIAAERPAYGTRRLAAAASREIKRPVNRKQVQRVCRETGLIAPVTTKKEAVKHGSRKVRAARPYEVWEADITYIPAGASWAYCYTMLDVFMREWVGYALSTTATAAVAVEALLDALHKHPGADPKKLTIRNDHGSQYTSREFNAAIRALELRHEYIWYKTPQQNGHLESFHGKLKFEYVWPSDPESFQEAEKIVLGAFADYNGNRLHSSIGYMPPAEFAAKWREANI